MKHVHPCDFCDRKVPCSDENCDTRRSFICNRCNGQHLMGLGGVELADRANDEYSRRVKEGR